MLEISHSGVRPSKVWFAYIRARDVAFYRIT